MHLLRLTDYWHADSFYGYYFTTSHGEMVIDNQYTKFANEQYSQMILLLLISNRNKVVVHKIMIYYE